MACAKRQSEPGATWYRQRLDMGRGALSVEVLDRINGLLPDPGPRFDQIHSLSPDMISIAFHPESDVPVAAVCLLDAVRTISAARYALFECHAHGTYYRDVATPPEEITAAWFEQYYMDDAAHRLYSAAEHIANGLLLMLEISDEQFNKFKKGATSQQTAGGRLLLEDHPGLAISKSIGALVKSAEWTAAMNYRGKLVHQQPPLVSGLGIVYKRGRRWRPAPNGGFYLGIGGSDPPEFDGSALIATFRGALFGLVTVWDDTLLEFMDVLRQKDGIARKPDGTLLIPDYYRRRLRSSAHGGNSPVPTVPPPAASRERY